MPRISVYLIFALHLTLLAGCQTQSTPDMTPDADTRKALSVGKSEVNKLLIVDCLLPSQVRTVGTSMTYLSSRQPIKTSAVDCELRGGEYTSYDRADYRSAMHVWIESAKQGDAQAQVNVGEIFEKGLGTEANHALAAQWYLKAAEQGNTRAAINLGYLYEKGLGVAKDSAQALNWYRKASGLDSDELQYASTFQAQAASQQREFDQALDKRQSDIDQLRKQLEDTQQRLREKEREVEQLINQTPQSLPEEHQDQKARIRSQQQQLDNLRAEVTNVQTQLDQLAGDAQGPNIELLDPPLTLTRGIPSVRLRSSIQERIIVGKATAPSGIASFSVNNRSESVDTSGIFQVPVRVNGKVTPVNLVAVDRLGQSVTIDFQLIQASETIKEPAVLAAPSASKSKEPPFGGAIEFGTYHALIIGNNNYTHYPKLESAINDARAVDQLLKSHYGFNTTLLIDADRYSILSALSDLRNRLKTSDNLLIYYAGHGELDASNERGHWLPVDAERQNPANWISNTDITDIIHTFAAKHVIVVADSCYAGSLTRSSLARKAPDLPDHLKTKWYKVMAASRSRTALTSGGLEPVVDSGASRHSIFAKAFLDTLQNNSDVVEAYSLFLNVLEKVVDRAAKLRIEQTPQYAPIRHSGHEAGEFLFVAKK